MTSTEFLLTSIAVLLLAGHADNQFGKVMLILVGIVCLVAGVYV